MSDTDFYIRYYVGMCLESLKSGHFRYSGFVDVLVRDSPDVSTN